MSLSHGQHPFRTSPFVIAVCAALLGSGVFLSGRPALAQQTTGAASDASHESDASAQAAESPAVAASPPTPAPVSPLLPGYVPTTLALANAPPPLVWKWAHFSTANYLVTGVGAALTLTAAIVNPRAQHSLSGGLWFDESVRNALRVDTLPNRYIFRDASDVGLSLMVSWPFVADALTTAWWYRGSREAAQEMALIDLETLAVSGAIQGVTNVMVSRERPYGRDCGSDELPSDSIDCANSDPLS